MKGFNLTTWALLRHNLVRYFMVIVLLAGVTAYSQLGRGEDPDFSVRGMAVRATWPGATAKEVDAQVTARLEKSLQELPHLDFVRSHSKPGEAMLIVTFKQDTPAGELKNLFYEARRRIGDARSQLPEGVLGPSYDEDFGEVFGSLFAITGAGYSPTQLSAIAERLRLAILRLPNVQRVYLVGEQMDKVYVEFDSARLSALGVDLQTVIAALQARNVLPASAHVDTAAERLSTRLGSGFASVDDIRALIIATPGRSLRLEDVAQVRRAPEDPARFAMRFQGHDAVGVEVSMARGGDMLALGKSLQALVGVTRAELPAGVELHQVANQPEVVAETMNTFMQSLAEALLIVLAVCFFSLGLRAGLVVTLAIPLVLSITFLAMWALGIGFNLVSLGALIIALGLLVDDAMIVVEMISVRIARGANALRAAAYTYGATAFPMLTGTLITVAGFMPVGLARSDAGDFSFAIFAVVGIALVASWLVAVLFTPYLAFMLLKDRTRRRRTVYNTPFFNTFRRLVGWCIDHRKVVLAATALVFVASLLAFEFVEQQFFPISNRRELVIDLWLPEGAPTAATSAEVARLERLLAAQAGVARQVAYIGGGAPQFFVGMAVESKHANFAQMVVSATTIETRDALFARLPGVLAEQLPAVRARVMRLENGPPVGYPVQFRVLGDDVTVLRETADRLAALVRTHPATRNVHADWNDVARTLQLDVDKDRAQALGVSMGQIGSVLGAMLDGTPVTQMRERDKLIDVVLRAAPNDRQRIAALDSLGVRSASGALLPLGQLATVSFGFEDAKLWRRNGTPEVTVRADVLATVQAPDVATQLEPGVKALAASLPPGYRIETGGALEASRDAQVPILKVLPWMLAVIVTLLMLQLKSFKGMLRVLISAPLGVVGVTISLLAFGQPFGFVAMLGVIALGGIIMRNSVILVEQIERMVANDPNRRRAIIEASVRRLRPIVLTAAATILAMGPLAQSVFWRPMAVAMMGGVLIATLLTLVFEPALYAAWFGVERRRRFVPTRPRSEPFDVPTEIMVLSQSRYEAAGIRMPVAGQKASE